MQTSAAYFDIDGTLLRGESQFSFLIWCYRRGIVPRFRSLGVALRYVAYLSGITRDATQLRNYGFGLLRGVSVERLEDAGREFFVSTLRQRLRAQSSALIQAHQQSGHTTAILTSACEAVARPVADYFQVTALLATRLETKQGLYTGQRVLPEPYGEGKRATVERFGAEYGFLPSGSFAYADHHSDVRLLDFVGRPYATNPTKKLRPIAVERGWPILDLDAAMLPDELTTHA